MLAGADFECREAASGVDALALLESGEEFDLLLTDMLMPDLDGIALLERSREQYPDMPVVFVTAVHDIQVALQSLRNGAYDYLLKPFERQQLLATVCRALDHRRLKREDEPYEPIFPSRTTQIGPRSRQRPAAGASPMVAHPDPFRGKITPTAAHGGTRKRTPSW